MTRLCSVNSIAANCSPSKASADITKETSCSTHLVHGAHPNNNSTSSTMFGKRKHKLTAPTLDLFANINSLLNSAKSDTGSASGTAVDSGTSSPSSRKVSDRQRLEQSIVRLFATGSLQNGELTELHALVRNILNSKAGLFLYDNYSTQILPKGLQQLCHHLVRFECDSLFPVGERLLNQLATIWQMFFRDILPTIECILFRLQRKCNLTIRQTSLRAFRDEFLLKLKLEESLLIQIKFGRSIPVQLKHMLLVLNALMDTFPPQKNKLRVEQMARLVLNPFHGYKGLYLNNEAEPSYPSSEPIMFANCKSVDLNIRRISRPLVVQPKQIETLNELFLSVIRRQTQKHQL